MEECVDREEGGRTNKRDLERKILIDKLNELITGI